MSIITLVSRSGVAMSAGGYFFKAMVVFAAQLLHPLGGSLFELGMVLVLPGTGNRFQCLDLAQSHQFLFCRLGEKRTAAPLADDGIDLGHQLLGNHDMGTLNVHKPTRSLTCYGILTKRRRAVCGLLPRSPGLVK